MAKKDAEIDDDYTIAFRALRLVRAPAVVDEIEEAVRRVRSCTPRQTDTAEDILFHAAKLADVVRVKVGMPKVEMGDIHKNTFSLWDSDRAARSAFVYEHPAPRTGVMPLAEHVAMFAHEVVTPLVMANHYDLNVRVDATIPKKAPNGFPASALLDAAVQALAIAPRAGGQDRLAVLRVLARHFAGAKEEERNVSDEAVVTQLVAAIQKDRKELSQQLASAPTVTEPDTVAMLHAHDQLVLVRDLLKQRGVGKASPSFDAIVKGRPQREKERLAAVVAKLAGDMPMSKSFVSNQRLLDAKARVFSSEGDGEGEDADGAVVIRAEPRMTTSNTVAGAAGMPSIHDVAKAAQDHAAATGGGEYNRKKSKNKNKKKPGDAIYGQSWREAQHAQTPSLATTDRIFRSARNLATATAKSEDDGGAKMPRDRSERLFTSRGQANTHADSISRKVHYKDALAAIQKLLLGIGRSADAPLHECADRMACAQAYQKAKSAHHEAPLTTPFPWPLPALKQFSMYLRCILNMMTRGVGGYFDPRHLAASDKETVVSFLATCESQTHGLITMYEVNQRVATTEHGYPEVHVFMALSPLVTRGRSAMPGLDVFASQVGTKPTAPALRDGFLSQTQQYIAALRRDVALRAARQHVLFAILATLLWQTKTQVFEALPSHRAFVDGGVSKDLEALLTRDQSASSALKPISKLMRPEPPSATSGLARHSLMRQCGLNVQTVYAVMIGHVAEIAIATVPFRVACCRLLNLRTRAYFALALSPRTRDTKTVYSEKSFDDDLKAVSASLLAEVNSATPQESNRRRPKRVAGEVVNSTRDVKMVDHRTGELTTSTDRRIANKRSSAKISAVESVLRSCLDDTTEIARLRTYAAYNIPMELELNLMTVTNAACSSFLSKLEFQFTAVMACVPLVEHPRDARLYLDIEEGEPLRLMAGAAAELKKLHPVVTDAARANFLYDIVAGRGDLLYKSISACFADTAKSAPVPYIRALARFCTEEPLYGLLQGATPWSVPERNRELATSSFAVLAIAKNSLA